MASNPSLPVPDAASDSSGDFYNDRVSVGSKTMQNKNVARNWIWMHGTSKDDTTIRCKYCVRLITGGVDGFKNHLAGSENELEVCIAVTDEVREEIFAALQEELGKKSSVNEEGCVGVGGTRKGKEVDVGSSGNLFKRRRTSVIINDKPKKTLTEESYRAIGRFFCNNAIPLDAANSDEFIAMCELVSRHGLGFTPPSSHEIKEKYFKEEIKLTKEALEEHRAEWKRTGCTIMVDGWADQKRRSMLKVFVNSPKGTVFLKSLDASHISETPDKLFKMMDGIVEEVGEENVVQIVTDNTKHYKAAGDMLMKKRTRLYWTPCAAHCIEMILEDFEKKIPIHKETIPKGKRITSYIYSRASLVSLLKHFTKGKDLVKQDITCSATSYLNLGRLHGNKEALIRMFTSKEWKSSQFAKSRDGKFVESVVLSKEFWKDIIICCKGAYPLIEVLRLVDSDENPAMGFVYDAMQQAEEKIKNNLFSNGTDSFFPLWKIISERWSKQLDIPLHYTGHFLNPQLHYTPTFRPHAKVMRGLSHCMTRMVVNPEERAKISVQIDDFDKREKLLGHPLARLTADKKIPSYWWEFYGDEHPELQKFAIRVLSLKCSSFGGERNRTAFEMVHTKRRNHLRQKTINDVVFVMANSKLAKKKQVGGAVELNLDDIPSDDEWIMENVNGDIEGLDADNLDLDIPYPANEDLVQDQAAR